MKTTIKSLFHVMPFTAMVICALVAAACGGGEAPPASESAPPASAPAASAASTSAASGTPTEINTLLDLFPPAPERDVVLNSCGSCHNVACSAIGQRPDDRWESLKESHKEKVSGTDLNALFGYLKTNFGASKPEPKVPPRFLEGGCTPF